MSYNRVIIAGNLGAAPELRTTGTGKSVCNLSVATSEAKDQVEWHRVTVWGEQAENCSKYLDKGSKVLVEGRLQTRVQDGKDGSKRYVTEIVASRVVFLSSKGDSGTQYKGSKKPPADNRGIDELPDDDSFEEVK